MIPGPIIGFAIYLTALPDPHGVMLRWDTKEPPPYTIYRSTDGVRYVPIAEAQGTFYLDPKAPSGWVHYQVGASNTATILNWR